MPKFKNLPSQQYLQACLTYDPETGKLHWRTRPREQFPNSRVWQMWNTRFAGRVVGSIRWGYLCICLDSIRFQVHRVIWKWMTSEEPSGDIDHADGDRANNRWVNLRVATKNQNQANSKCRNKVSLKGVYMPTLSKRFASQITVAGRHTYLGTFDTVEEAHAAYCQAAQKAWGEFWHP